MVRGLCFAPILFRGVQIMGLAAQFNVNLLNVQTRHRTKS